LSRSVEFKDKNGYVGAMHGAVEFYMNDSGALLIGTEAPADDGKLLSSTGFRYFTLTPSETARFVEWLTGRPEFQNAIKEYKDDLEYENEGNVDV
jgi:hypothetical protein